MNQKGFSMIELIAVLTIMGLFVAFIVPKVITLDRNAEEVAIRATVTELNTLELQAWTTVKFAGEVDDEAVLNKVMSSKSEACNFTSYSQTGGTLTCKSSTKYITRIPSTQLEPGRWKQ
jgi:prepilin-type N-terminal cleavage/methylation domain-containing protein